MSAQPGREIVPAHPYDLSEVMSGTFRALRRRPGLYLGLTLAGLGTVALVVLVLGGAALLSIRDSLDSLRGNSATQVPPAFVVLAVLLVLGVMAASLVQLKASGMMALATQQLADGREPTLRGLWSGTRGFVPRVVLLVIALYLVVAVVFGVFIVLVVAAARTSQDGSSGSPLAVLGIMFLLGLFVLLPLTVFLSVRWFYVLPVLAIERPNAFAALRRSWRLTSGRFWRTLGYWLVAIVIVAIVQSIVSLPGQISSTTLDATREPTRAELTALIGGIAVSAGLSLLSSVVTTPFMSAYQTLMYVDARRRSDGAPMLPAGSGPAGPGGYGPGGYGPGGYGPGGYGQGGSDYPYGGQQPPLPQQPYGGPQPPPQNPYA